MRVISDLTRIKSLRIVLPALVAGLVPSAASFYLNGADTLYLEVRMSSSVASTAQVFFNMGRGENEEDSDHTTLVPSAVLRTYRFRVPAGETLQGLRFDALDGEGQVRIASGSVITSWDSVLQRFSPADFLPKYQFVKAGEDAVAATFVASRSPGQPWDPMLSIRLDQPIQRANMSPRSARWILPLFVWMTSSLLIGLLIAVGTPDLYFRVAIYFTILFQIVHFAGLPPLVSYDGMQYCYLARLLFTPSFYSSWDFQRTPLLPFLLKMAFFLSGDQPVSAILPNILFGAGGILVLGSVVKHVAGKTHAAAALLLLNCYPYIVGYQHIVLTEIGTFFMFALLLWCLLRVSWSQNKDSYIFPAQIALVLALGYYQRPTFIYLAPLISGLYILLLTAPVGRAHSYATLQYSMRQRFCPILARAAVIMIVPWLLCWPWRVVAGEEVSSTANRVMGYGMTKQAMIPPDDPRLGSLGAEYGRVVKETMSDGGFHPDGLGLGAHFPMFVAMDELVSRVGPMAFIRDYPWRYVKGWFQTMIVYMGYPREPVDCENTMFSRAVFREWPPDYTLEKTLGWDVKYDGLLPPVYNGGGALGQFLALSIGPYSSLLLVATWTSLLWLVFALRKADPIAIAMAGVPLGFLALHALTLFSASRYSFPTYPLFLANLICVGHHVEQSLRRFLNGRAQNRDV